MFAAASTPTRAKKLRLNRIRDFMTNAPWEVGCALCCVSSLVLPAPRTTQLRVVPAPTPRCAIIAPQELGYKPKDRTQHERRRTAGPRSLFSLAYLFLYIVRCIMRIVGRTVAQESTMPRDAFQRYGEFGHALACTCGGMGVPPPIV